jgi:S-adenosylmethionine hydrolase
LSVVTLTTDFGLRDGYVGTMKGVILSIAPQTQIVDISHDIALGKIAQAAYVLASAAPFFPDGTVHVVVVDPGVGSSRRALALRTAGAYYVGPDNGVLSYPLAGYRLPGVGGPASELTHSAGSLAPGVEAVQLDRPQYRLPSVSNTFHGRDIFAPAAAHLAAGVPFVALGTPVIDPATIPLPWPQKLLDGSIRGAVLHRDKFGNLITDIPVLWLETRQTWLFHVGERLIDDLSVSYDDGRSGSLIAVAGSQGLLEIAVSGGNAADTLCVDVGEPVSATPRF